MDDIYLAQKAAMRDWEALVILVDRHGATLFRVAYGEVGRYEDAQDAVAEAIVRVDCAQVMMRFYLNGAFES